MTINRKQRVGMIAAAVIAGTAIVAGPATAAVVTPKPAPAAGVHNPAPASNAAPASKASPVSEAPVQLRGIDSSLKNNTTQTLNVRTTTAAGKDFSQDLAPGATLTVTGEDLSGWTHTNNWADFTVKYQNGDTYTVDINNNLVRAHVWAYLRAGGPYGHEVDSDWVWVGDTVTLNGGGHSYDVTNQNCGDDTYQFAVSVNS